MACGAGLRLCVCSSMSRSTFLGARSLPISASGVRPYSLQASARQRSLGGSNPVRGELTLARARTPHYPAGERTPAARGVPSGTANRVAGVFASSPEELPLLHTHGSNSELLRSLNAYGARFLVIGGLAVSYYCRERIADDLDLLIEPTPANAERVRSALLALGMDDFQSERLTEPRIQVPLKRWHYADILTPEDGFDFSGTFARASAVRVNAIPARVPRARDLMELVSADCQKGRRDALLLARSSTGSETATGDTAHGR